MAKIEECGSESFVVESIEGTRSLSELLELIKSNTTVSRDSEESPVKLELSASEPVWTWMVSEGKSEIDDSPNVTLTLFSNDQVSGTFGGSDRPTFVIRCRENKTEAYIATGNMLDSESATIRLDSEQAYPLQMSKSTDGRALFFPNTIMNIKKFWKHEKMVFRFTPYHSGSITVTFNIGGLEKEIVPLRRACHW
jgi:type VI secretion system protein VasI